MGTNLNSLWDQIAERAVALTVEEVATIIGCSPKFVYRLCREGKLPHTRIHAHFIRIDPGEFASWLRSRSFSPRRR